MKRNEKPEYICKLSIWKAISFWFFLLDLLCWIILIGGIAAMILKDKLPFELTLPILIVMTAFMIASLIPITIFIARVVVLKTYRICFFSDYIITEWGVFNRHQRKTAYTGIVSVSISRPFWGYIFNYGHIRIDMVGKWDLKEDFITRPRRLQRYLARRMLKAKDIRRAIVD